MLKQKSSNQVGQLLLRISHLCNIPTWKRPWSYWDFDPPALQRYFQTRLNQMRGLRLCRPILRSAQRSSQRAITGTARSMSQREDSIPHELRTAAEPRQNHLYPVRLSQVDQVNPSIRLLRLALPDSNSLAYTHQDDKKQPFIFLPGQWLDVHIPSIAAAGGFTITSTPADAQLLSSLKSPDPLLGAETSAPASQGKPYVELAVQNSPSNPPAAWLWRPKDEILGKEINIRVGGSFVWPPTGVDIQKVKNVVFIAGGVGINPLISILTHLHQTQSSQPLGVHFLYTSRLPQGHESASLDTVLDQVLFLPRLRQIIRSQALSRRLHISLDLFLTNSISDLSVSSSPTDLKIHSRRINENDLDAAVVRGDGKLDPQETVAYICGPPQMTDEIVESLKRVLGVNGDKRVFFEKWW
ncbi:uncharacterized protein N7498_009517 [Penicillium cinerascens]|uniref:FAD-binding FR-type domain-containing protein n=1 Tax=Penicillium cinerascens TaxID=70096 RepID=A0A9W9J618_9EURO|nr:uncharacterized protein N7498_009517 [Penicillium cinerascens]KAJ5190532.1 hypothetical protein N7498_009517 [Penicillium cinerascens]